MEIEEQMHIKGNQLSQQIPQEKINEIKRLILERQRLRNIPSSILNRRYKKLQQVIIKTIFVSLSLKALKYWQKQQLNLIAEDEFFTEDEIKMRQPLLYFLYCGQYMKSQAENFSNMSFADFLEDIMMKEEYRQILEVQYNESREKYLLPKKMNYDQVQTKEEVEDNEDELICLMHTKFLIGEEKDHFNYEEIDNDESLDDKKILEQDQEDKYFDDQDEDQINPNESEYTGIEDY